MIERCRPSGAHDGSSFSPSLVSWRITRSLTPYRPHLEVAVLLLERDLVARRATTSAPGAVAALSGDDGSEQSEARAVDVHRCTAAALADAAT